MPTEDTSFHSVIENALLEGSEIGLVNKLSHYDRKRHTLPTEVNEYTEAFLARLVEEDLAELTERYFAILRQELNYKRKEISVSSASPSSLFEAKDFTFEITFGLDADTPSQYVTRYRIHTFKDDTLLTQEGFNSAFDSLFDSVILQFRVALDIESIIDNIEEDDSLPVTVEYPSHCEYCELHFDDEETVAHCAGNEMRITFPQKQAPLAIHQSFLQLEKLFQQIGTMTSLAKR